MISSETLFHFTNSAANLISILENEFQPSYVLETVPYHKNDQKIAYPMVCFCDLPLSQVNDHIGFYGCYGIGLSKTWAIKNGLNPVSYINSESFISQMIVELIVNLNETNLKDTKILLNVAAIVMNSKEYFGEILRGDQYIKRKFYDEKEWRFIPKNWKDQDDFILPLDKFNNKLTLANANSKIKSELLIFEPNDIKYIIVKSENEILPMIEAILRIKEKYDESTKRLLCSRIISADQIKEDF